MRYLLLPFFVLSLFIKTAPTLLVLFLIKLLPYRAIILSLIFFSLISFFTYQSIQQNIKNQKPPSKEKLYTQQHALENALKKQPTHRDIILNLSKVYQALGKDKKSEQFYNQAQQLDPNYSLFQK